LFVDRDGLVLEGSIYNIAFWDGDTVVWPDAPMLTGITMQLVQRTLESSGVPQRTELIRVADLPSFTGAFFTNSICARQPVLSVDDVVFPGDPRLTEVLEVVWRKLSWERL
jgi:4-amino-4-deoxychorismate lyase